MNKGTKTIEVSDARIEEALELFRIVVRHLVKRYPLLNREYRNTVCSARPYPMTHEWLLSSGGFEICAWCCAFVKSEREEAEEAQADGADMEDDGFPAYGSEEDEQS